MIKCPQPYDEYFYDEEFSFKDFTNRSVAIGNDLVIYSSCFLNETPDAEIFPSDMTGVTFIKCNLDNILIPEGNFVIDCSQKRFEIQNDLNDWIIDENNEPTLPIDHEIFVKFDLPIPSPEDIPDEPVDKPIDLIALAKEEVE